MNDDSFLLPTCLNISPKTIGEDIFPYIPGDPENMKIWDDMFKKIHQKIKKDFDEKGIPLPTVEIDYTKGPITYGIKTINSNEQY